jgi:hypothetical protein
MTNRFCTVCLARFDLRVPAVCVAGDADGMRWYECGVHVETDNIGDVLRTLQVPLSAWPAEPIKISDSIISLARWVAIAPRREIRICSVPETDCTNGPIIIVDLAVDDATVIYTGDLDITVALTNAVSLLKANGS